MSKFNTFKNFDRNKIIIFSEKTKLFHSNADASLRPILDEAKKLLIIAKEPFKDGNNWPQDPSDYYNKFVPVINVIKKLIADKAGLESTLVFLENEKDKLYEQHCREDSFWRDIINDKKKFDLLPHVIGTLIDDKFLVFDGHHRTTAYCLKDELSLSFDAICNS